MLQMDLIHADSPTPDVAGPMDRGEDMEIPRRNTLLVAGLRCVTAALAMVTTRLVMAKGFHYPYHLLLVHALAILLFQAALRLVEMLRGTQHTTQDWSQCLSGQNGSSRWPFVLLPCLHMACVIGTLLCVYQATFHFIALPVLAMLLILDWSSIFPNTERSPVRGLLLTCISICGMALMFAFDRKLSKGGIIGSLVAIVLIGLARSMDAWMKSCCDEKKPYSYMRWQKSFVIPLVVVLMSPAMIRRYEHPIYTPAGPVSLGGILAFNIACVVAAWWCNSAFFTHTEPSNDNIDSEYVNGEELRYLVVPVVFVGLVAAGSSFDYPPFMVSAWQHVGFLIAMSAIYVASYSGQAIVGDAEKDYQPLAGSEGGETHKPPSSQALPKRISCALMITLVAGLLFFMVPMYWPGSPNESHRAALRSTLTTLPREDETYSLDFVVSRFDESANSLAENLAPLLELEATRTRATRIVVYNTGDEDRSSTFHNELQLALRSSLDIIIEHRPNVGREGAAFLHHIVSQYDNLADHTVFMQAELHQPRHVRRLLQNYLVPQTGFLSLSSLQDVCSSCDDCWDHSTWSESQVILEDIYSRANHGAKCKDFVLTYRGQFVASRTRIQFPGKELFGDLLDGLTNPKSDKHNEVYVNQPWLPQKIDSLNAPLFGYTLERIWGVLMGCSDKRLASTCPSRLSASMAVWKVGPSNLSDCQCLDDHVL